VVLFDEIEKAHADVFHTVLQVLDDGRLTDAQGRTVDFRNTVVIMTSNIGSDHLLDRVTPDGEIKPEGRDAVMAELSRQFRPECLNRVDDIVLFKPLTQPEIERVVDLMVDELRSRLADRRMTLEVTREARRFIARRGFDPVFGARPLRRYIAREVETRIGRARDLAGRVKLVKVNVDDNPRLVQRFAVRAVPTLLVMLDGQVVAQQPGAPPTAVLRTWLEDALSRAG
jgi:ATP-dependent Clp protease ATP-binding subunit ClpB